MPQQEDLLNEGQPFTNVLPGQIKTDEVIKKPKGDKILNKPVKAIKKKTTLIYKKTKTVKAKGTSDESITSNEKSLSLALPTCISEGKTDLRGEGDKSIKKPEVVCNPEAPIESVLTEGNALREPLPIGEQQFEVVILLSGDVQL
jgi:hypothetical protein